MKLKRKFMMLALLMGVAIVIVCAVSYHFASDELEETTNRELSVTVAREAAQLNGWLETKKAFGESTSNVLTSLNGDMTLLKTQKVLGTVTSDKEILDMAFALEDKYIACYYAGDITGKLDPTTRAWYNNARDLDKAFFTAPYIDVNTNAYIVSIGVPVKADGKFIGATCLDLSLETLSEKVKHMGYHGEGAGIILEADGNILATGQYGEPTKNFREIDGLGSHFGEMISNGRRGYNFCLCDDSRDGLAYRNNRAACFGFCAPQKFADVVRGVDCRRIYVGVCNLSYLRGENHDARCAA